MDDLSDLAFIPALASAGFKLSIKLSMFSDLVESVHSRVNDIALEVSLTSGVVQQLGDLLKRMQMHDYFKNKTILTHDHLLSLEESSRECNRIFGDLENGLMRANDQIQGRRARLGGGIVLADAQLTVWPFPEPNMVTLWAELGSARRTLLLILQVTELENSNTLTDVSNFDRLSGAEQTQSTTSIVATQQQSRRVSSNHLERNRSRQRRTVELICPSSSRITDEVPAVILPRNDTAANNAAAKSRTGPPVSTIPISLATFQSAPKVHVTDSAGQSSFTLRQGITNDTVRPGRDECDKEILMLQSKAVGEERTMNCGDTSLEAFTIMPVIEHFPDGYEVFWNAKVMPFEQSEVAKELQRLQQSDERTVCQQLDSLTKSEYEALQKYILNTRVVRSEWPHAESFALLAAVVEEVQPPEELVRSIDGISTRRVKFIAKRIRSADIKGNQSKDRKAHSWNAAGNEMNLSRTPWTRVHYTHCDPRILNGHGLPWQWDDRDLAYIFIEKWLPKNDLDTLFEQTKIMLGTSPILESKAETGPTGRRTGFCRPLTNLLKLLGFKTQEPTKNGDKLNREEQSDENRLLEELQDQDPKSNMRHQDGGEEREEAYKTRKDIEIEIEELEREKLNLRIQNRNQKEQNQNMRTFSPIFRFPPPASTRRSTANSNLTLPSSKITQPAARFPSRLDSDTGLTIPDDQIPDFGPSLVDLAFDDQTVSSVLGEPTWSGDSHRSDQPMSEQSSVVDVSGASARRPGKASQRVIDDLLSKYTSLQYLAKDSIAGPSGH